MGPPSGSVPATSKPSRGESDSSAIPSHCFLRISIAGGPPQTVVIELHKDTVPTTCRNFVSLCNADTSTTRKRPLPAFRGTEFHRIVPGFMVQGGDFEKFDGSGGYSSFSSKTFADENFRTLHSGPGVVSMANRGPNTNGSQFFITLQATPHLNGKHVAFGQVVEGMEVVQEMARVELDGARPIAMQRIVVVDCGAGRGTLQEDTDSDSSERHVKKKKKRKSSTRRKRDRHRDDSSSSSKDERRERKKKKKDKRSPRRHDSDSDLSSVEDRHQRHKSKHRRSKGEQSKRDRSQSR